METTDPASKQIIHQLTILEQFLAEYKFLDKLEAMC